MLRRWFVLLLTFAIFLAGCAFRNAINRGNDLAGTGDWRGALAAYQEANRIDPDDEEAVALIAKAKPQAIQLSLADASIALDDDRFEDAMKHVKYVLRLESKHRGATGLGDKVEARVAERLEEAMKGDTLVAYDFAVRARGLFPELTGLSGSFETLRGHYYDESDERLRSEQFASALESVDIVAKREPEQRDEVDKRRRTIKNAWADVVVVKAKDHGSRGHKGAAAALYARAYEIAGRGADRDAMRGFVSELRDSGTFKLALDFGGDQRRIARVSQSISSKAKTDSVKLTSSRGATLHARVDAPNANCHQEHTVSQKSQRYVSGTRQVPNPKHAQLEQEVGRAQDRVASSRRQVDDQAPQVDRFHREVRDCVDRHEGPARAALSRAQSQYDGAQRDYDSAKRFVDDFQAQFDRIDRKERNNQTKSAAWLAAKISLDNAKQRLAQAEGPFFRAKDELAAAERSHNGATQRCAGLRGTLDSANSALASYRNSFNNAQSELGELRRRLGATPRTLTEELWDTFHYDVQHHTRTCDAKIVVKLQPRWSQSDRKVLSDGQWVKDSTHPAFSQYGVSGDPLTFSMSDDQLISAADTRLAADAAAVIRTSVNDFYRTESARARTLVDSDPHAASGALLALYLGGGGHVDGETRNLVAEHLRRHYELGSLAVLKK